MESINQQNLDWGLIVRQRHPNIDFEKFKKWKYQFLQTQLKRLKHKEIIKNTKS